MRRARLKPSKPMSFLGMVAGAAFVFIGITQAIPHFGLLGLCWTGLALLIGLAHAYNFFSKRGLGLYEVELPEGASK